MNTKRKVKDYIGQNVAIYCSSKEEWDKIVDLFDSPTVKKHYWKDVVNYLGKSDTINITGRGWSFKEHFIKKQYTIYPASDFLEEEPKFDEGKWYKNIGKDDKAYAKCKKFEKNCFYLSDHISKDKQYRLYTDGSYFSEKNYQNAELLTDLSEIQQYLPEGHVDKIKTEIIPEYVKLLPNFDNNNTDRIFYTKGAIPKMENWSYRSWKHLFEIHSTYFKESTKEAFDLQNKPKQLTVDDLIKGGIYVLDINKNKDFISKFDCIESDNYYDCCFIYKNEFENDPDSLTISEIRNIRLATQDEKKWLNTCITQDKFISKSDLHLYDESGLLIKKEEAMFKKNDYIVVLYNDNSLNSWTNQCFKQLEDLYYLKVVKNLNGNTDGWSVINFENQSKWRYASSAEILEYERIGKPFDVTTLIKKEKSLVKQVQEGLKLKGRWLKCIKECDWNNINIGEYVQIEEDYSDYFYVKWKDNIKNCLDLERIKDKEFEIMPEGFSPNEKEWIPKIGDWCVTTTHYNDKIWYKGRIWQIGKIDEDGFHIPIENEKLLDQSLKTGFRKASEKEIAAHLGTIIHNKFLNEYSLIPNECFKTSNYNSEDIYIAPIIKKETKIQTITIESTTDLNLNLTKIKSKQIQTIKI